MATPQTSRSRRPVPTSPRLTHQWLPSCERTRVTARVLVLPNVAAAEGSRRVQRIPRLPGGVPPRRWRRWILRQGAGRAAAPEARIRRVRGRRCGLSLGEPRGTGEEVRTVRAAGRLRDDGPRGAVAGGEGAPRDLPRDASPDPARGRDLCGGIILPDLPALHTFLRSEPGGREGRLRPHGRVEKGGGGPGWEIPFQDNAIRAWLLLDSRVPSEFLRRGVNSIMSDFFFPISMLSCFTSI